MKTALGLLFVLSTLLVISSCQESTQIPTPANMSAEVKVTGRLSKLIDLDIKYVGKKIPYTYSKNKIANSPDYYWWVSKHFAIKSDLPEHKVKLYLELLELSYPHYVSLFGAEPANIENQRIAVVYGASRESTKSSMLDDGFTRGVHEHAGGETMYYNRAGYSFPSDREQHQRYIVIHETMHAYHMALTGHSTWAPNWITEGLADSIASHVYYPQSKELAVMVFDRAPMNYIQSGLKQYAEGGQPSIEQINNDPALKRGLNFFIIHFLLSDPERAFYFSLFRDRLMAANPHSDETLPIANKLLKETFPDWQKLEQEFTEFVSKVYPSFMIAKGPWEQDGDRYWIRTYNEVSPARLDIRNSAQPTRFDFPQPTPSSLVDQESSFIAATVIDFVPEHINRGASGLALGLVYGDNNQDYFNQYEGEYQVNEDTHLSILIHQGRKLIIDGVNMDFKTKSYALSAALTKAIKSELKLGISANFSNPENNRNNRDTHLKLTLKTANHSQSINIEITPEIREAMRDGSFSLLANNNKHKLTPYFSYQPSSDSYFAQVDAKQWTSNLELYRIFKTCIEFKLDCPAKLKTAIKDLAKVDELIDIQQIHQRVLEQASNNDLALLSLSGLKFYLVHDEKGLKQEVDVPDNTSVNINSQFAWWADKKKIETFAQLKKLNSGSQQLLIRENREAHKLTVRSNIEWLGNKFAVEQQTTKGEFDGVYLTPELTIVDGRAKVTATLTGPYSGDTNGTLSFELFPNISATKIANHQVTLAPYESKAWQHTFTVPDDNNHQQAIEVTADLVVDGEGVLLSEMIYLNN